MKISDILKRNSFLLIFIAAFIFYGFSAGSKINEQSKTPQFVYLANSFLQGRTDLAILPKSKYDLISFNEKWYVPGGVTPALLYLPFVIVFGNTFSDVLFGVLIGALNVAMMYSLLCRLTEKPSTRLWLTFLFAFGTSHWWLASPTSSASSTRKIPARTSVKSPGANKVTRPQRAASRPFRAISSQRPSTCQFRLQSQRGPSQSPPPGPATSLPSNGHRVVGHWSPRLSSGHPLLGRLWDRPAL